MTAPYSRVYWSVMDDPKFDGIREDARLFGSWSLLLIVADMAHPAPALIPRTIPKTAITRLAEAGLVDLMDGFRYRIHGLAAERGRRADTARNAAASRWQVQGQSERNANALPTHSESNASKAEHRQDETRRAEQPAHDPWDDPEHEALVWLAKHGCDVRPGNGYHRKLVTAVEVHGVNALVGMMDRLADAGTKHGDVKGFLFGAIDALDARNRPSLRELDKSDRQEDERRAFQARLERTRRETAGLRTVLEEKS